MENSKIKEQHLSRIAYVYIRQSTVYQVMNNLESQRRQYELVDKAKSMGFKEVLVIDEDLGVSGSGGSERSGFKKLVAEVSLNKVGIILGLEVSRFARNNRDWYQLIDMCSLFDTLIADQDGVYHPGHPNDRMILGLKGTMSEVELNLLKGRMLEGALHKAKRGELITCVAAGYEKGADGKVEKDPDERIRKAIGQVFSKFRECQSVRQTFLWFVQEGIQLPSIEYGKFGKEIVWKTPLYSRVYQILKNPIYSGAYSYGKVETRKKLEGQEIKVTRSHPLEMKDWKVLMKNRHEGYIGWEEYEKNQKIIQQNAKKMGTPGPVSNGNGLFAGLLRCKQCGRRLRVFYGGKDGGVPRYECRTGILEDAGEKDHVRFGGQRFDEAVSEEILKVIEPLAIEASLKSIDDLNQQTEEKRQMFLLELEAAQYEAERAYRQYNKIDPENRLVASQLESKWNECLQKVESIKAKLAQINEVVQPLTDEERTEIMVLSQDLPKLWNAATTTNEMKKKIIRTVIEEIVVDVDHERSLVLTVIHWVGGVHSQIEIKKNRTGEHKKATVKSTIELVRQLARQMSDPDIAALLNKLKLKSGIGATWTMDRVRALRYRNDIPVYQKGEQQEIITLEQAAEELGVSPQSVRTLIQRNVISASQIISGAPWAISIRELEKEKVKNAVQRIKNGSNRYKDLRPSEKQIAFIQ